MNDDEINTNAEYSTEDELNQIEGKDGEALDAIEQDQVVGEGTDLETTEGEEGSKKALEDGIIGDDDNQQDDILDA